MMISCSGHLYSKHTVHFPYSVIYSPVPQQNVCSGLCLAKSLFSRSFFATLQIDLEPEGKVFVAIELSGSSSEGKDRCSSVNCPAVSALFSGLEVCLRCDEAPR